MTVTDEMVERACAAYWTDWPRRRNWPKTGPGIRASMSRALEAALSVPAQGAEPVAWITADAIESLQADGMCALAAGRKQSAVYSVPIYTNPVPVQGAEPFAWYWFDQHDCLYIVADSRKPEFPEAVYPLYTHPNP